jgi:hypothetical protein
VGARKPAIGAALAAGVLLAAAPAAGSRPSSCAEARSRTVVSTRLARVYYTAYWQPFSCYRLTGRLVALDAGVDRFYSPGEARLGRLRFAGRVLAYTWIDPGIPAVFVHSVDMRTGRFRHRASVEPVVSAEPDSVRVSGLVVRPSGGMAWIQVVEGEVSVWRFDAHGREQLDVDDGTVPQSRIDPSSLRLARSGRLTWAHGAVRRAAGLR